MQIEAIYYATAIAVVVKDFDPTNSMHSVLKNMLEQKGFKPDENPNTWVRRSFAGWDNYLFWKTEVDKLVEHFLKKNEPQPQPSPKASTPDYAIPDEPADLEKVADKIKKLFALAQSPNEAEAMAAFAKAQELLTRYNLSMTDLADSTPEEVEEQIIAQSSRRVYWQENLLDAVATANYCHCFVRKNGIDAKQMMLGRPVNIKSAKLQFEYLVEAVERLANLANGDRAFKNAFKLGASQRLSTRITEGMERQKKEGINTNDQQESVSAIVVRSLYEKLDAEIKAYIADNLKIKTRSTRPSCSSSEGFFAGQSAGDRVSLNKQVKGGNQRYLPG
jgi:hypothetical protein